MAVKLVVTKYVAEQNHGLDCTLCDEKMADAQFTTLIFWDQVTGQSFNLCADHLDMCVSEALRKHREAMKDNNPTWYLDEDDDPWKEADS